MKFITRKMNAVLTDTVEYSFRVASEKIVVNDYIGKPIRLAFSGAIYCVNCSKKINKSFQGFCFNCFQTAANAAECIIHPELCRAHLGEGRDVEWEQANHNQPHVVYLALSSEIKVGVTRTTQVPTRWIDQGASAAIRLMETPNRFEAGRIEVALKSIFTDKTNWQKMLKNEINESIDLVEEKWRLHEQLPDDLTTYFSEDDELIEINYPVLQYPKKINSLSFDKQAVIEKTLIGIKGQYLLFDDQSVLNIRKHEGYEIEFLG